MRIVVNYRTNLASGVPGLVPILTRWTKVSFTYIVVSRIFSGSYSDIWATVAEVQGTQIAAANGGAVAVDLYGFPFQPAVGPAGVCSAYKDPAFDFEIGTPTCGNGLIQNPPNDAQGGRLVVHAYIMGFGWDPARSSDRFLAASVFNQNYLPFTTGAAIPNVFPDSAEIAL
jgi:hypothetical protein